MIGDHGQDLAQVKFRIDTVQFRGSDQRIHRRRPLTARVGARKEVVLAPQGNRDQYGVHQEILIIRVLNLEVKDLEIGIKRFHLAKDLSQEEDWKKRKMSLNSVDFSQRLKRKILKTA